MCRDGVVHRIGGQVQLAWPGQHAIQHACLPECLRVFQAGKNPSKRCGQKLHLAFQSILKPHMQRSVVLYLDFGYIPVHVHDSLQWGNRIGLLQGLAQVPVLHQLCLMQLGPIQVMKKAGPR